MNTLGKIGIASALSLSYVSAHAAFAVPTSTTPGDVILFAEVLNSSGTLIGSYAGDTKVAVSNTLAAGTLISASSDANLASLISLGTAAGNSIVWGVEGGGGTGTSGGQYGSTGASKFVTTLSVPGSLSSRQGGNLSNQFAAPFNTAVIQLNTNSNNADSVFSTAAATGGLWDSTTVAANVQNWFQGGANTAITGLGSSSSLYYVTGGGGETVPVLVSSIGNVSLTAAGLTFSTGTAAVPLPAAIWLLGSGLLGLAGVGRRKTVKTETVAA